MIGSVADINITIGNGVYRLKDVYGKTLYAAKPLPFYKSYLSKTPQGQIKANEIIGIVQGYIANGYKGAKQAFIIVGDNTKNTKVVPYAPGNFSETKLKNQGTKTTGEVLANEDKEAQPWYIKLAKTAGPFILVAALGYGYINRRK